MKTFTEAPLELRQQEELKEARLKSKVASPLPMLAWVVSYSQLWVS
jgi:hypothetical protein